MKSEKRWFDDEDFTPEHDLMMEWLFNNYKSIIRQRIPPMHMQSHRYKNHSRYKNHRIQIDPKKIDDIYLRMEPGYQGYPTVYPDADCLGTFTDLKGEIDENGEIYKRDNFNLFYWFIFEIKTKITSFGSVLRQLQIYRSRIVREYDQDLISMIFLITDDERFDELFRNQMIEIIHPSRFKGDDSQ